MKRCESVFHLRKGVGVTVANVVPGDVTAVFGLEVAGWSEDTHTCTENRDYTQSNTTNKQLNIELCLYTNYIDI